MKVVNPNTNIITKRFEVAVSCNGFGFNLEVFIGISGSVDPDTGLIRDLSLIKKEINQHILDHIDHNDFSKETSTDTFFLYLAQTIFSNTSDYYNNILTCEFCEIRDMNGNGAFKSPLAENVIRTLPDTYNDGVYIPKICISDPDLTFTEQVHNVELFNGFKHKKYSEFNYELLHFIFPSHTITVRKGKAYLTLCSGFSATHSLIKPDLDLSENINLFGPCARLHGHQFLVNLTVKGDDIDSLKLFLDKLISPLDGHFCNEHPYFLRYDVVSCENMLDYLYDVCLERLDKFFDIELQETFNNYFYKRVVDG